MLQFSIIDAPSVFGLRPTGVEVLPEALKAAGLLKQLNAEYTDVVHPKYHTAQNVIGKQWY